MSIKLRRYEEREQIRTATEKMKDCLISAREIFHVTIVLCLNINFNNNFTRNIFLITQPDHYVNMTS